MTEQERLSGPEGDALRDVVYERTRQQLTAAQDIVKAAEVYLPERLRWNVKLLVDSGEVPLGMSSLAGLIVELGVPVSESIVSGITAIVTGTSEEPFLPSELSGLILANMKGKGPTDQCLAQFFNSQQCPVGRAKMGYSLRSRTKAGTTGSLSAAVIVVVRAPTRNPMGAL